MQDINRLSAAELAARIQRRELRAIDVVEACLERIALREPEIHAWACLDVDYARRQARTVDRGPISGPLHGIPVAVKDIIDTAELPTAYGSPIYAGHRPEADAACVTAARDAGAIVLGKSATTEFACQSAAATVNPHNFAHTPGGSSSGSAAAVADDMVPLGFGTQTAGSIIRPASYCGIVGYKPTFGLVDRSGVRLVAQGLDTIGALGRSVADAALLVGAVAGRKDLMHIDAIRIETLRIGLCRTHDWRAVDPFAARIIERAADRLAVAGARIREIDLPQRFADLGEAHRVVQGFEASRNFAPELRDHRPHLSAPLLQMLDEGGRTPLDRYQSCLRLARECRSSLASVMGDCDVLLTAAATGEAPEGLASTGSPVVNRVWTLLHVPCIAVPASRGPNGLPIGVQIVGRVGDDARTLAAADCIHRQVQVR